MAVRGNKLYCPDCDAEQPQINFINCVRCSQPLGAPNVNEVSTEDEQNELQKRYDDALTVLHGRGLKDVGDAFERYFTGNVRPVINLKFEVLETILIKGDPYKNYYRITDEGIKNIALPVNDRRRCIVDGYMFGKYGTKMAFAALSLENAGLDGYDSCTIVLDETLIQKRATVLEENSYNFVKKHGANFENPEIPAGYRSIWENKYQLAIAKLHGSLNGNSEPKDFCRMVLFSDGTRDKEEFMEVHIYNEVTTHAIKSVHIPKRFERIGMHKVKRMREKHPDKIEVV